MHIGIKKGSIAICSVIVLSLTILFFVLIAYKEISSMWTSLFLILTITIFAFLGTNQLNSLSNHQRKRIHMTYLWSFLFLFYVIELGYLLYLSPDFSRDVVNDTGSSYMQLLQTQWSDGTNLVPFRTIKMMIAIFSNPYISSSIPIINIFGNIAAFMPFAFFGLLLSKKMQSFWRFALTISFLIIAAEVIQLITITGSLDIDDYILNFSGSILCYLLLKTPPGKRLLQKLKG